MTTRRWLCPCPVAQDGDHSYIRLNFNFGPGYEPCVKFPGAICLKELSFRTADTQHAAKVCMFQHCGVICW